MRDTFAPGSDGVYLAQGAVPPHDNVVTERISRRAPSHPSQGSRNATREGPQTVAALDTRKGNCCFSRKNKIKKNKKNDRLARRLAREREQTKLTGLSTHEHFTQCDWATVELLVRTAIPSEPFVATPYVAVFSRSHRKTRPRSFRRE